MPKPTKTKPYKKPIVPRRKRATAKITKSNTKIKSNGVEANVVQAVNFQVDSKSLDSFVGYLAQLVKPNMPPVRIPLSLGQTHLRKVKMTTVYNVNSTGALAIALPISAMANVSMDNTHSPMFVCNNNSYNPTITTNALPVSIYTDAAFIGASGLALESYNLSTESGFNQAVVVAAHIGVHVTGVSNLSKKGRIFLAEDLSSSVFSFPTTVAAAGYENNLANRYAIPNISKLKHCISIDMINNNSDYTYNYIPEYNHGNIYYYKPGDCTGPLTLVDTVKVKTTKYFILIGEGLDPNTQIQLTYEFLLQIEPGLVDLNTYPIADSTCYKSPDAELRFLEHDTNIVFTKGSNMSPSAIRKFGLVMPYNRIRNNHFLSTAVHDQYGGDDDDDVIPKRYITNTNY